MKISITLTNFNHAEFLPRCIEAFIGQSYKDWELVVVDDGSTDNSWSIIEEYQARDPRIRAERFPSNRGALIAVRQALSRCTGELLYGAAADDFVCNPRFFELAVSRLQFDTSASGAFGISQVVNPAGKPLWRMGVYGPGSVFIPKEAATSEFLSAQLFIPGTSAIWRRDLVTFLGGYDEKLGPQCDYYVNHALAMLGGVFYINEVISVTRLAEGSLSQSASDEVFFERHAQVEKRLRSLGEKVKIRGEDLRIWRRSIINGRLSLDRQMRLVRLWKETFADVQEWERAGLMPEFAESEGYLKDRCRGLEQKLEVAEGLAKKTFDDIAGPIQVSNPAPSKETPTLRRIVGAALNRIRGIARDD